MTEDGSGAQQRAGVEPARVSRTAAVQRLLELDARDELTPAHVRLVAQALGRSERTVRRWLSAARAEDRYGRVPAARFTVTADMRTLLARWGGNASRVHAELVERARLDPASGPVRQPCTGGSSRD